MQIRRAASLAAVVGATLAGFVAAPADAALTVANTTDSGPGSLRQTVAEAGPGETVNLPAGTYTLTSGELWISDDLTLTGEGSATTTIRAGGPFRVIQVSPMIMTKLNVTIGDVTVRDGVAAGTGTEAWGGGVFAINAHLTLRGVLLTNNRAVANGAVAVAGKAALGGGVADVSGVFTMLDSTVSGNAVEAIGGAGEKGGTAQGGGAAALGVYRIERSTIAGNVADARGGQGPANASQNGGFATGAGFHGISEWPEPSSIGTSTISGNVADASAGAGGSAGEVAGAGLFAVAPEGPVTAISTTIAENIARNLGNPGKGAFGGGAFAVTPAVSGFTFTSMTIAANGVESSTPASYGGNAFVAGPAGGIVFGNSLIANGAGPAGTENCYTGLEGVTSQGFNLDSRNQCGFKAAGDLSNTDPLLLPLQDNGGPTRTLLPAAGSPAVDQGRSFGLATDQRGLTRPVDLPSAPNSSVAGADGTDIGAAELQLPPKAQLSNAFKLGKVIKNKKKGSARIEVILPQPSAGTLTLTGKAVRKQLLTITGEPKAFLPIVGKKKVRKALQRRGKRKVALIVTYTPSGTPPAAKARTVKLVKKRKKPPTR